VAHVAVIINPIAGAGRRADVARQRAEQAAALVEARRVDADVFVTERQGHARELAGTALRRGARTVIAWGGDGTVNEVASALIHTDAALAIVPSGSGNGLARELRIPTAPAAAFDSAFSGHEHFVDAGELDGHFFFNIAGFGLDARVAHRFAADGLRRRGFLRYLELAARELATRAPLECTITMDTVTTRVRALIVALANGRQYGNGALIAPNARLDDGLLDLVVIDDRPLLAVLFQIRRLFSGALAEVPGVSMVRATSVEVSADAPLLYHVDGEPHSGGYLVKATVHPHALRVISAVG